MEEIPKSRNESSTNPLKFRIVCENVQLFPAKLVFPAENRIPGQIVAFKQIDFA